MKRSQLKRKKKKINLVVTIFCDGCGDTLGEGSDELAQLDALLERLGPKHYDLRRNTNLFHSPIVRQLPPDVMSTVFEFCLPGFKHLSRKPERSVPLSLGAICSYWREVAWSTPTLWSSLVVRVKPSDHATIDIVKQWLARSGQLPLSIRILSSDFTSWEDRGTQGHRLSQKLMSALADIINQYSARWSRFELGVPYSLHFFPAISNHVPILKYIRFHCVNNGRNYQLTCPSLKRASLYYFQLDGTNIRWDNLTHLDLYDMYSKDCILILHKTPRLVSCKISRMVWILFGDEQLTTPLILTSLRSLQLINMDINENFLNNLIAPRLEELSISRCVVSKEVIASLLTSDQQRFLNLEVLEYIGGLRLNHTDHPFPPADSFLRGRFRLLKLDLYPATRLPKNFISYFLSLAERGVTVNVLSRSEDILQSSIDFYRGRGESLTRDWVDNLDLSQMQDLF